MTRIVAFDFDGTLSDSEMLVLLGEAAGARTQIEEITNRAMNDELSYTESLRERARLLKGLPERQVRRAYRGVTLRQDAADVIRRLRAAGIVVVIITGGFTQGVEEALSEAGVEVDAIVANRLPMAAGQLTGDVEGPLVEGTKDEILRDLAEDHGVPLDRTVAVGDGANDLPMLETAGLAVGYAPKEAVEPSCDVVVNGMTELTELFRNRGLI